jgi:hypothetical protein
MSDRTRYDAFRDKSLVGKLRYLAEADYPSSSTEHRALYSAASIIENVGKLDKSVAHSIIDVIEQAGG